MKRIGLIGGIGPESTIAYYRMFIKRFRQKMNTNHLPEIHLLSIDMMEMLELIDAEKWDDLVSFLAAKVADLSPQVEVAALASNTPHIVFDELNEVSGVPLISIVHETIEEINASGIRKLALLGTRSTMQSGFYQRKAEAYGIEVMIPKSSDLNFVHDKYMNELVNNVLLPKTKGALIEIVDAMIEDSGIEGLILGGTELPLIVSQADFERIKVFDSGALHVEALINVMTKSA